MFSCVIVYHITNALSSAKSEKAEKVDVGTIAPPEGECVSARTVSERGRQPRSLTDYKIFACMP
jgi:hypothetical protein